MTASFTVLYQLPSGWWTAGTFATHAEADARRIDLEGERDEAAYPTDATAQFDVLRVHP